MLVEAKRQLLTVRKLARGLTVDGKTGARNGDLFRVVTGINVDDVARKL